MVGNVSHVDISFSTQPRPALYEVWIAPTTLQERKVAGELFSAIAQTLIDKSILFKDGQNFSR